MALFTHYCVTLVVFLLVVTSKASGKSAVQVEEEEVEQLAESLLKLLQRGQEDEKRAKSDKCGGVIQATDQVKTLSPPRDSEGEYYEHAKCKWVITAPRGQNVELHFTLFDLENRKWLIGTCNDYLRIFDGMDSDAPHIGTYCVKETPPDVRSSGRTIFLDFYSDWNDERKGFDVEYKVVGQPVSVSDTCINTPSRNGGSLTPVKQGLYSNNMVCQWSINAPEGKRIRFKFHSFDVEPSTDGLCYDYVYILDGTSIMSPSLVVACGNRKPRNLDTTGNMALVVFESDDTDQFTGFELEYKYINLNAPGRGTTPAVVYPWETTTSAPTHTSPPSVPTSCQGQVTTRTGSGQIYSPGFDSGTGYLDNLRCRWRIEAPDNFVIKLSFHSFKLESSSSECYDTMRVYDGYSASADSLGILCGSSIPQDIVSSSNFLFLKFKSDSSVSWQGFGLTYVAMRRATVNTTPAPVVIAPECGQNVYIRVAGGEVSPYGKYPWLVHMRTFADRWADSYNQCGGSLIHKQWVLTAAHCLEDSETRTRTRNGDLVHMYFGEHDLYDLQNEHSVRKAVGIFFPPDRTGFEASGGDIALIKLNRPVVVGDYINLICLPPKTGLPARTECTSVGWGKTHYTGSTTTTLRHVDLELISNDRCRTKWYPNHHLIGHGNICAERHGQLKASCQGDSGGPLGCWTGNKYELAGVVSWGNPCGKATNPLPTVYTRVSAYLNWINQVVGENS